MYIDYCILDSGAFIVVPEIRQGNHNTHVYIHDINVYHQQLVICN